MVDLQRSVSIGYPSERLISKASCVLPVPASPVSRSGFSIAIAMLTMAPSSGSR